LRVSRKCFDFLSALKVLFLLVPLVLVVVVVLVTPERGKLKIAVKAGDENLLK
jgi:lipopolysaccharide/colanic/teichoic acid biosynthesis glycosyltransferase